MDAFVSHPLVRPNTLQARAYQEAIAEQAIRKNLLCVLPTGLGKTPISVLVAAERLRLFPDSKILMLAPTRPLASQSCSAFKKFLELPEDRFTAVTGTIPPEKRKELYARHQLIFATPQTIQNDFENKLLSFEPFSLAIFDESHHSIGGYSYPFLAQAYLDQARHPRILGLTASPGATKEKIEEICRNLGIEAVQIRSERDTDVQPYVHEKLIEWIEVELPERFQTVRQYLQSAYQKRLAMIKALGYTKPLHLVSRRDLLDLQLKFHRGIQQGYAAGFRGATISAEAIKLEHALTLLETQGIGVLRLYFEKLQKDPSRAGKSVAADRDVSHAAYLTRQLQDEGARHPKMASLCRLVHQALQENKESRIIVFANYRETVKELVSILESLPHARPVAFMGQKEGLTQKEQLSRLERFRNGEYNILVGTSISEEGLDIASANIAVFYEPVASPLRSIQRRGRVGRAGAGRVVVLITKHTRDEAYYWSAIRKEKRMRGILHEMREQEALGEDAGENEQG